MTDYKFKGTPGNWSDMSGDNASIDIVLDNNAVISVDRRDRYTGQLVGERSEMEANAHIISAAPDLLEALLKVKQYFPSDILSDIMNEDFDLIDNAIHKALNLTSKNQTK